MSLLKQLDEKIDLNWRGVAMTIVGICMFFLALVGIGIMNARAEGIASKGGAPIPIGAVSEATNWNGFGVGVYGGWVGGHVDIPGYPVNIGSEGTELGGQVSYSVQAGVFVAEVFGEYGFLFGDAKTIGFESAFAAGGKAGILVNPSTQVYGLAAKSWINHEQLDLIEGWQFGGGVAVKLPSAPLFVSLEYRRGLYEVEGFDLNTDTVRVGLTYKFGGLR